MVFHRGSIPLAAISINNKKKDITGEDRPMQKLRLTYVKRLIESNITAKEIDFIVYLSHFQSENGTICGVYYKDVCSAMFFSSYQTFYNVLHSLEQKNLIKVVHNKEQGDFDVTFVGNDCSNIEEVMKEGYINTNKQVFYTRSFQKLKSKEKLLLLHLIKITGANRASYRINKDLFYRTYTNLLGVTKRVIRGYLKTLKQFFSIGIKDKLYYITAKVRHFSQKDNKKSEKELELEKKVMVEVRRAKIKEFNQQQVEDTAKLFNTYKESIITLQSGGIIERHGACGDKAQAYFSWVISETIKLINPPLTKKNKVKRILSPAFANKITKTLVQKLEQANA